MVLIIGGAYQGKLDFAMAEFGVTAAEVFTCKDTQIDFSKRCVRNLEVFSRACAQAGIEPRDYLEANRAAWENSIFICRDISCGVVPMGAENRLWRQKNGAMVQYLSREADRVSRIFCGLEQRLK